jgi:hypothetical protein
MVRKLALCQRSARARFHAASMALVCSRKKSSRRFAELDSSMTILPPNTSLEPTGLRFPVGRFGFRWLDVFIAGGSVLGR